MSNNLYNTLSAHCNEKQNLVDLRNWCNRQSQLISNFGKNEEEKERLYESSLRDAFSIIGKGLHLK